MLKNKLQQAILKTWSERGSDHFHLEVGLSGGVDSVVLLHALIQLQPQLGFQLSAVHVNHQLQAPAAEWAGFCQDLCQAWAVPLRVEVVNVTDQQRLGTEAAARASRYQAYANTSAQAVVLAHHADDQMETAFLGWLRGGGIRAMAAMPAWRSLHARSLEPLIWRPLLGVSKQDLVDYAQSWGLENVEDPSNSDETYLRNWLRQQILPNMLQQRPELSHKILAGVEQMQRELAVLEEIQAQDWAFVHKDDVFQVSKCLELSPARREQQLLYVAKTHQLSAGKKAQLTHFVTEIEARPASRHQIVLNKDVVFVDRARLYAWGAEQRQAMADIRMLGLTKSGANQDFCVNTLAMSECIVNTQIGNHWRLVSLGVLRDELSTVTLKYVTARLKQAKVPLLLMDLWPCWYDVETQSVFAAQLQDQHLRLQHPSAHDALAFLQQYTVA